MKWAVMGWVVFGLILTGCSQNTEGSKSTEDTQKAKGAVEQALKITEQYIDVLYDGDKKNIREFSKIYSVTVEVDCAIVQSTKFADQCEVFRTLSSDAKAIQLSESDSEMKEAIKVFANDADDFMNKVEKVLAR